MENGDKANAVVVPAAGANADAGTPPVASDALVSLCPLCYEVDLSASPRASTILSACQHRSCQSCMVRWIEREEASGRTTPPGCPFCRCPILDVDVRAVLGRPFIARKGAEAPNTTSQMDDLTRQWIEEHTVLCGGCGHFIEKAEGCNLIECLCGYRFCFRCGEAGGTCDCNPGHDFLNGGARVGEEPIRDRSGQVDLRSCILRRQIQIEREHRCVEIETEEHERWNWSERSASVCTENGRWLFSSRTNTACVTMLAQQLRHGHVADERRPRQKWRKHQRAREPDNLNTSWLFLSRGKEIRAMEQLLVRCDVQLERFQKRFLLAGEVDSCSSLERELNLAWLFLPNQIGFGMLKDIRAILRKHINRQQSQKIERMNKVDAVIARGDWLFRKSTQARSEGSLRRLVKHSRRLERKGWSQFLYALTSGEENEEQSLESTLFIFP